MKREGQELLAHMLAVTLDLFRLKTGVRINNDETYRIAKDQLLLDFKTFERSISTHPRDYHHAVAELQTSLIKTYDNDLSGGFMSLEKANHYSLNALREVTVFEDKIFLTRIQVMFALHEHHFYDGVDSNHSSLQARCRTIFDVLSQTSDVTNSVRQCMGKQSMFSFINASSHSEAQIVLDDIHGLSHFFSKYLGSSFLDNKIDWKTLKPQKLARAGFTPEHPIQCIATLGDELYTANNKGLSVWKIRTNTLLSAFDISIGEIKCMIEHQTQLITGTYDGAIRVWDLLKPGRYQRLDVMSGVVRLKVFHDKLYVATHDRKVHCFDLDTYTLLEVYDCDLACMNFTIVETTLYVSALTNEVHRWDTVTHEKKADIEVPCTGIVCLHDTLLFGVDTYRTKITVYDLIHGSVIITFNETAISMYAWGSTLVVTNGSICLWDLKTFVKVRVIETKNGVKDVVMKDNRLFYSDGKSVRLYLL